MNHIKCISWFNFSSTSLLKWYLEIVIIMNFDRPNRPTKSTHLSFDSYAESLNRRIWHISSESKSYDQSWNRRIDISIVLIVYGITESYRLNLNRMINLGIAEIDISIVLIIYGITESYRLNLNRMINLGIAEIDISIVLIVHGITASYRSESQNLLNRLLTPWIIGTEIAESNIFCNVYLINVSYRAEIES